MRGPKWGMRGSISGMREPLSSLKGPNSGLRSWLEVFVFHWGFTRLRALGDDQGGPVICARGATEPILPLQDMFEATVQVTDLFLSLMRFVPPTMSFWPSSRGVTTKSRLGDGSWLRGGGHSGESKPSTPKFWFLILFRPLYFRNQGKSENVGKYSDYFH